jgi:Ala-tRNA(Pro) deacylase
VDVYDRLVALLDTESARYRLIDHAPEGKTELVSELRGSTLQQSAKCIVVMVKVTKKISKYVLAVVVGDARVDLNAIKAYYQGTYVGFATQEVAERLAQSQSGTILPFSFNDELQLIADPALLQAEEIYFNAARLDRSIALATADYERLARPLIMPIAVAAGMAQHA